ncbi:MAG TPA: hypothetical protein VFU15_01550 [Bacteroidia bacterium]|nr:hypothetical protein [Bacteroidia bacterium]
MAPFLKTYLPVHLLAGVSAAMTLSAQAVISPFNASGGTPLSSSSVSEIISRFPSVFRKNEGQWPSDVLCRSVSAEGEKESHVNCFRGAAQVPDARDYSVVNYNHGYNNIDLRYYACDEKTEYDFVAEPGGNAQDVVTGCSGIVPLFVAQDHSLHIVTAFGGPEETTPVACQLINGDGMNDTFGGTGTGITDLQPATRQYMGHVTIVR